MQLSIIRCPDKTRFRPYIKKAVHYYAQQLMAPKALEGLRLKIQFDSQLDEYGYASVKGCTSPKKDRQYLIEINPHIGARDILDTLAHEMVHIKQYVYGETNESLTRWKGQMISADIDYFNHPWEIEAYGMSRGLFTKFVVQEKLWEVFAGIKDPQRTIEQVAIGWLNTGATIKLRPVQKIQNLRRSAHEGKSLRPVRGLTSQFRDRD